MEEAEESGVEGEGEGEEVTGGGVEGEGEGEGGEGGGDDDSPVYTCKRRIACYRLYLIQ